jgi:hypothetical protein
MHRGELIPALAVLDSFSLPLEVTPAKAGVQGKRRAVALDSRVRGNDVEMSVAFFSVDLCGSVALWFKAADSIAPGSL